MKNGTATLKTNASDLLHPELFVVITSKSTKCIYLSRFVPFRLDVSTESISPVASSHFPHSSPPAAEAQTASCSLIGKREEGLMDFNLRRRPPTSTRLTARAILPLCGASSDSDAPDLDGLLGRPTSHWSPGPPVPFPSPSFLIPPRCNFFHSRL